MNDPSTARIVSLIGEPACTAMLAPLMDGRAFTAGELVRAAGVPAATGSRHLALMVEGGLLRVTRIGRHRYYRIASPQVAAVLEGLMQQADRCAPALRAARPGPRDEAMRRARTCYGHLAGRLGVAIAQRLEQDGALVFDAESCWLTARAAVALAGLGIALAPADAALQRPQRAFCRPCMDWSERRAHLAGHVASTLCRECLSRGWLQREPQSRALQITPGGQTALRDWLGPPLWHQVMAH